MLGHMLGRSYLPIMQLSADNDSAPVKLIVIIGRILRRARHLVKDAWRHRKRNGERKGEEKGRNN